MSRSSHQPNSQSPIRVDDYEDFGYDVKNAKRVRNKQKQQRKFKDYTEYDDWLHFVCH